MNTPAYPDTREGALALLVADSVLTPADLEDAEVTPDPEVTGCWCVIPVRGDYAGKWFLVYVGTHPDAPGFEGGE